MAKFNFSSTILLVTVITLTSCGNEKLAKQDEWSNAFNLEWSNEFYHSYWTSSVHWCNDHDSRMITYVHSSTLNPDPDISLFDEGQTVFTTEERNLLGSSDWFLSSGWSLTDATHRWYEVHDYSEEYWTLIDALYDEMVPFKALDYRPFTNKRLEDGIYPGSKAFEQRRKEAEKFVTFLGYELRYNVCSKDKYDRGLTSNEWYRCIWDHVEANHTERDWRYYSKEPRDNALTDADKFCLSKYPKL